MRVDSRDFTQWKILTGFFHSCIRVSTRRFPSGCRWSTSCCVLWLVREEMQPFQGKSLIFFYFTVGWEFQLHSQCNFLQDSLQRTVLRSLRVAGKATTEEARGGAVPCISKSCRWMVEVDLRRAEQQWGLTSPS